MSKRIIKNEGLNGYNRNLAKNKMKISYLHVENTKISSSFRLTSLKLFNLLLFHFCHPFFWLARVCFMGYNAKAFSAVNQHGYMEA